MIKLVCIKEVASFSLPDNKVYLSKVYVGKSNRLCSKVYEVSQDDVYLGLFDKSNFIPLAELRELQIKSVLDD